MAGLEPKFILKEPNRGTHTLIYLFLNWKGKRLKISTSETIIPEYWDKDNQRPISNKKQLRTLAPILQKELSILSIKLDEIDLFVNDLILDLKRDKTVSLDTIQKRVLEFLGRKMIEEVKPVNFIEYFTSVVTRMENSTYLTDKGTKYSPNTIKSYKSNLLLLTDFEKEIGCINIEEIDIDFYNSLLQYCNQIGFRTNTTGSVIKRIKAVLHTAFEEGISKNTIFQSNNFKAVKEKVYNIYLTSEELKKLIDLPLSGTYEKYRDVFLIGCYVAQRYSDYSRISPEHIQTTGNGNKVIDLVQIKTKQRVLIPFLFPELDTLLQKYDYKVPKIVEQPFNRALKKIGELAGIDKEVVLTENIGGETKERLVKKYELITSHTARRTGATNLFLLGYSAIQIMKVTGHTTAESLMDYIKVSLEENADKMATQIETE